MKVDTFRCDVCGRQKGENNHWFRIDTAATMLELHAWGAVQPTPTTVDLCSDHCVITSVQQWLTGQAELTANPRRHEDLRAVVSIGGQRAS